MWTIILLYLLIFILGFFIGIMLPLMNISDMFRKTYQKWIEEEGHHDSSWDEGAAWYENTFYRNFYGGKE